MLGVLREIVDKNRNRFRRMTGCLQNFEADLAKCQRVTLSKSPELKVGLGLSTQANRGANAVSKFNVTREEIGVKMGEKNVVNVKLVLGSVVEVLINITLRVHHNGGSSGLIGNELGGMRETTEVVLFHPHDIFLLCVLMATSPPRHP